MCASYGLGGGPYGEEVEFDFEPMSEKQNAAQLLEWMEARDYGAKPTGKNALNFNPLIIEEHGARKLEFAWWWIYRGGAPAKYTAFNARDDTLLQKWKFALKQRALAPATWYVEKGQAFGLDGELFAIASITTPTGREDAPLSYALVTRDAVGEAANVHNRMPLVLPRELHDDWLDPDRTVDQSMIDYMVSASDEISHELSIAGYSTLF